MPINEDSIREKKEATVRSIVEATGLLLKEKMGAAPHARAPADAARRAAAADGSWRRPFARHVGRVPRRPRPH
jgi:hypothetical protein